MLMEEYFIYYSLIYQFLVSWLVDDYGEYSAYG